ncbi:MAG: ATP-binding cassette domain-containing protein [Acidimicrobiales bacterium]
MTVRILPRSGVRPAPDQAHDHTLGGQPYDGPLLEVCGLTKHYGPTVALESLSFTVDAGECVGLVGANGAGKSTVIALLSGVTRPTAGTISLAGRPRSFPDPLTARKAGVETLHQRLALVDTLDVVANFHLGRELHRTGLLTPFRILDRATMRRRTEQAVAELDLAIRGGVTRRVGDLSGGQRQAVAIARAAYWRSRLLLLDEPTAALGHEETTAAVGTIRRAIRAADAATVFVSHDLPLVHHLCDRVVVLRQGRHAATLGGADLTVEQLVSYMTGAKS